MLVSVSIGNAKSRLSVLPHSMSGRGGGLCLAFTLATEVFLWVRLWYLDLHLFHSQSSVLGPVASLY